MSYAVLLTLLSALAFGLPFLVRLAENADFPRSYGILATLAVTVVAATYGWLRWRLRDDEEPPQEAAVEPGVLPTEPYIPGIFFSGGVFRGEQLLAQGQLSEALRVYRAYQAILDGQGQRQAHIDEAIASLEEALKREEDERAGV